ncbi:MAG TPA: hypothetical protein VKN35_00715, partial [Xanthomonadales bacterium]|nr:hypothetical protein [Xanthomonadales bacterium]
MNAPVADPNNYGDPAVALNAGDGFSTTQPWTVNFVNNVRGQATLDPGSVIPGQSIRFFEVSVIPGTYVIVTGVVEELIPGVDYVAVVAAPNVIAIIPLIPLKQLTTYMAVITDDVTDSRGNNATPDQTYFLTKRQEPWVDAQGNSTYSLVDNATAQGLAQLQPITHSQEAAAASVGIDPASIVLSWTAQTQSITPVLGTIRSTAQPGPTTLGPTGMTTAAVGGAGIADIYMGIITLPYYLGVPSAENPIAPLVDFWKAAPNGYVPPYNQFGLDPT